MSGAHFQGGPAGIADVLRRCREQGVRLSAAAGQLRVQPGPGGPDAALLALLRERKTELLALLAGDGAAAAGPVERRSAHQRARMAASPAQRRMVLLDQMDGADASYNMVGAFEVRGTVDWAALRAALGDVMARHEALRTSFDSADGVVRQVVAAGGAPVWEELDVSDRPAHEQAALLQDCLRAENRWRFDLGTGPLLRVKVLRMGADSAALIVNVHHVACDGGSVEIIKRDWAACYAARCAGTVAAAPADLVQYGDYCHWLQGQQARQRAQLDYWVAQLAGAPQLHSLPLDYARPPRQGHAGRKLRRVLPAARLARVREQCGVHGVTLFMYLQTAFAAVLSLYANEADIVMGTPVAGRRHRDLGATVGLFVNTVVLRSQVDGHAGFAQLLAANQATIVQALEHQDLPFDDLLEHLAVPRSRAFSPLVQILFALQTQLGTPLDLPGAAVADLPNDGEPVKVDLQLVAQEQCGQLQLEWHYNACLFAPASIARMADTLDALLDAAVAQPDTPLFQLPLARHDGRQAALRQAASAAPRQRLEQMVAAAAGRHPQRTAVCGPDGALTYAELERQATALAVRLHSLGVGRGSVAGLHLEQSPALLVAMLAVLKTGAAYLPLYPALPAERLQLMLDDSGAAVLVTASSLGGRLTAACTVLIDDDSMGNGRGNGTCLGLPDSADLDAGDAAYVLYTSGTTGQPKGVIVAHAGVANLLDQMDVLAPLPAMNGPNGPNGLLWSNMSFDVSVYEIYSMLCRGGTLHLVPEALRLEPRRLFQWMDEREIGSAFLHAAYLAPFGDHAAAGGGRALRRLLIGVEPIAAALVERVVRHLPALRVINGYGPTESTICCTLYLHGRSAPAPDAPLPIGRAVQGLELRVMNPAGGIAPPGAIGELYVAGIGLALGYLRRPALDSERFVPLPPDGTRFYRTGDLVRLNGDDELVFIGRCDRQVKVRGFRVELGEVETRLCQLPGIAEAAVLVAGEGLHARLLAYVVTDDAARALPAVELEQQVRHGMRAAVPEYMVPARVIAVERMPRNASGKVHTALLPAPSDDRTVVAPRNAVETRLLRIWRDVLETDDLGVTDDFFAMGGQSLLAMLVLARTREQFGLGDAELSVTDLLDHPTIESFARTYALVLAAPPVREKIHYLSALADPVEEGVI